MHKKTVNKVKLSHPTDFVRVLVDPVDLCLKVARKPKDSDQWIYFKRTIGLPSQVLNVSARKVPEDLEMPDLKLLEPTQPIEGIPSPTRLRNVSNGSQSATGPLEPMLVEQRK